MTVWTENTGFFSLLGLTVQGQKDFKVPNLGEGEYVLLGKTRDNLDIKLLGAKTITIDTSTKQLLNNTKEINASNPAVTTGITGKLTTDNTIKVKSVETENADFTTTPTPALEVEGKYGKLIVNPNNGDYVYKSYGDPEAIGKVESFEYTLEGPGGVTATNSIHIQYGLTGEVLPWNPSDVTEEVTFFDSLVADTNAVTLMGDGELGDVGIGSDVTSTIPQPGQGSSGTYVQSRSELVLNGGKTLNLQFDIDGTDTVISFKPNKVGLGSKTLKYEILTSDGDVLHTENVTIGSTDTNGQMLEVSGLQRGSYVLSVTQEESGGNTFGVTDLKQTKTNWTRGTTAADNILADDVYSIREKMKLLVNKTVVLNNGTTIEGQYGTLTMDLDGSYSYKPYGSVDVLGKTDVFNYTVLAPNGDKASSTLSISISGNVVNKIPPQLHNGSKLLNPGTFSPTGALPFTFSLGDGSILATPQVSFNQDDE